MLQIHWGTTLAKQLAANPDELDRLGFYSRIQKGEIAFAPIMSLQTRGEVLNISKMEQLQPLSQVVEIEPGIRGAFAVQRQYDGQWATPWKAQPFRYWTIHRNDFHAQFLSVYLDEYGKWLFNFWQMNLTNPLLGAQMLSTNLEEYLAYGMRSGNAKDFGRTLRQDAGFVCLKGGPMEEIDKLVNNRKHLGLHYEIADLVLWTGRSLLSENIQNLAKILGSARSLLRPGGGILVGVPFFQKPEDASLALAKIEPIAHLLFGEANVRSHLVGKTDKTSYISMSYIFMRK